MFSEEIKSKTKKFLLTKGNVNITYKNLQDAEGCSKNNAKMESMLT